MLGPKIIMITLIGFFTLVASGFTYLDIKRKSKSRYGRALLGQLWIAIGFLIYAYYLFSKDNFSRW